MGLINLFCFNVSVSCFCSHVVLVGQLQYVAVNGPNLAAAPGLQAQAHVVGQLEASALLDVGCGEGLDCPAAALASSSRALLALPATVVLLNMAG